jgi:hypothetical protein
MHRLSETERTAYCHRQACACAAAASAAAMADVREAYVNLEQGWLTLAAKAEVAPDPFRLVPERISTFDSPTAEPRRSPYTDRKSQIWNRLGKPAR